MDKTTLKWCVFLLLFAGIGAKMYDPHVEGDFCRQSCNIQANGTTVKWVNTACQCRRNPYCRRYAGNATKLISLRKNILDAMNFIRADVPTFANMLVLTYDVSLEYQAYCYAMKCLIEVDEVCRASKKFPGGVGQVKNTKFSTSLPDYTSSYDGVKYFINENWYKPGYQEYRGNYQEGNAASRDWACIVWYRHTHIGCAVTLRVGNYEEILATNWVCNFGGGSEVCGTVGAEMLQDQEGYNKCRDCNSTCNKLEGVVSQIATLCGTLVPVPEEFWQDYPIVDPGEHIRNDQVDGYPVKYTNITKEITTGSQSIRAHFSYIIIIVIVTIIQSY